MFKLFKRDREPLNTGEQISERLLITIGEDSHED
ncbi:hypothetical protein LAS9624_01107 [Latilactobacillus sakei]|nr:hypothetical protein LAS9624_01107 [Latilactobacillus sakei]